MAGNKNFLGKYKSTLIYGASLAILLFVLRWVQLRVLIFHYSFEIYIGLIAFMFTGLGIWLALKLSKPKVQTVVVEKEVFVERDKDFVPDASLIAQLELSKRELDVLALMASGHSNDEIAARLFVSLSTVKTHNQNLFVKLDVKRRTQAVEKAKRLNIIP